MDDHSFVEDMYPGRVRRWDYEDDHREITVSLNPGWKFSGTHADPHMRTFPGRGAAITAVLHATVCTCVICTAAIQRRQYEITSETRFNHEILGLRVGERHYGFVTVDFEERSYRMGYRFRQGKANKREIFKGRGWKARLVEAARETLFQHALRG